MWPGKQSTKEVSLKKRGLLAISLLLLLVLMMGACAQSPPAEPESGGEVSEEQETFHIKFSTWHPPAGEECQNV